MGIRENLDAILGGIAQARQEPLGEHPLALQITHNWRDAVAKAVSDPGYKVKGSAGKGYWAHTIWLAVFDRMITESAQQGFYVVYLVPQQGERAYLSLNQATEEIYSRVGGHRYLKVLQDTAARDLGLLENSDTERAFVRLDRSRTPQPTHPRL